MDFVKWKGRSHETWRPVETDFDPFPRELRKENHALAILHQIGNVGELVRWPHQRGEYGIAGGDFDTEYDEFGLELEPHPYDEHDRYAMTGFRLVIVLEGADPDFRKRARLK